MPQLTQGQSVTLTLGAHDSVSVQCSKTASALITVNGSKVDELSGHKTYGPYSSGTSFVIVAGVGRVDYEQIDGEAPASLLRPCATPTTH